MTSPIVAEIRALPADEQLPAALAVIEDLTGLDSPGIRYLIETMGLTAGMARVLWALHRASPRILSRDQLARVMWGHGDAGDERSIDSQIKRIRARTDITILTTYGVGYSLARPLNIPTLPMPEVIAAPAVARDMRALRARVGRLLADTQDIADEIDTLTGPENDRTDPEPVRGNQQRNRRGGDDHAGGIHGAGHVSRG